MSITRQDIEYISKLARLKIKEDKIEKYATDLSNIVEMANTLNEVNTDNIKAESHILDIKNVFRKDEVKSSYNRDDLFINAPTKESGCISVPKVVE
jgi:aspartyl-tRNA(Asn)/glutamyl-tRNA(Gln) amidotransferase subunit C